MHRIGRIIEEQDEGEDPELPQEIPIDQVKTKLDAGEGDFVLLDCREPTELQIASIDGATHVPMGEIPSRVESMDREKETVVFCHHGQRSLNVAAYLEEQGFTRVRSMAGGIDAWSCAIDPSVPRY